MDLIPCTRPADWLDRFAQRLGELDSRVTANEAFEFAQNTFPDAADMQPEEAAEIFAMERPPLDP